MEIRAPAAHIMPNTRKARIIFATPQKHGQTEIAGSTLNFVKRNYALHAMCFHLSSNAHFIYSDFGMSPRSSAQRNSELLFWSIGSSEYHLGMKLILLRLSSSAHADRGRRGRACRVPSIATGHFKAQPSRDSQRREDAAMLKRIRSTAFICKTEERPSPRWSRKRCCGLRWHQLYYRVMGKRLTARAPPPASSGSLPAEKKISARKDTCLDSREQGGKEMKKADVGRLPWNRRIRGDSSYRLAESATHHTQRVPKHLKIRLLRSPLVAADTDGFFGPAGIVVNDA